MEIIFHERIPKFSVRMPGQKDPHNIKIVKPNKNKKRTIFKISDYNLANNINGLSGRVGNNVNIQNESHVRKSPSEMMNQQ